MRTLRLGTRKSALAQAQANWTAGALRAAFPETKVEIALITTSGDVLSSSPAVTGRGSMDRAHLNSYSAPSPGSLRDSPPAAAGNDDITRPSNVKALFTKEIEEALLDKRIDLAVHSLKDMSAELPKGLIIGAVPEREDPRDAWISKNRQAFRNLPAGTRIGTGSVRRQAQLKRLFPSADLIAIRGNVDTRLRKLADGELDGIVLAVAGLKRLGHEKAVTEVLPIDTMLPAVSQGCLGIQIRDKDSALLPYMKALDHAASHAAALCERAFLKTLGGSCQTPIAGHAAINSGELTLYGLVISPDGQHVVSAKENGRPFDAEGIGQRLGQKLLENGADKLLA